MMNGRMSKLKEDNEGGYRENPRKTADGRKCLCSLLFKIKCLDFDSRNKIYSLDKIQGENHNKKKKKWKNFVKFLCL